MQLMDEDYADAYEFICSLEPAVQDLVKTIPMNIGNGFPHQEHLRENAAKKIGMMLSKLPVQNIQVDDILKLNNLDNMPQDPYMVKALTNISGKEGYREVYIREQKERDRRDDREREFPLEPIIEAVEAGSCRPPLIIELDSGRFVIDGRTRLYAAVASNKSLDVTVITTEVLGGINDY
jgi:hypothetical protein